jgi:phospholipid/cholesterol/gamma-HCH transport system substrate-binding protein
MIDAHARNFKVGLFLAGALVALFVLVFLFGEKDSLFRRKAHLFTSFHNAAGLVAGTPVRLAGVQVGIVESIDFDSDLRMRDVHVRLGITRDHLDRIRADSIARLNTQGLLGDVVVDISVGSATASALKDGDSLRSEESAGLSEIVSDVKAALAEVQGLAHVVRGRVEAVVTNEMASDLGQAVHSAAGVLAQTERGPGLLHTLVYDGRLGGDVDAMGASLAHSAASLDRLLSSKETMEIPAHLARVAVNLDDVVAQVRSGKGLAHTLVYDVDRSDLGGSIARFSATLRGVSDDIDHGRGTIGALIKDPTVYEDLKGLIGNLSRSRLLRFVIRYTIAHDGLRATKAEMPSPTR